jgi:hypothetical protein
MSFAKRTQDGEAARRGEDDAMQVESDECDTEFMPNLVHDVIVRRLQSKCNISDVKLPIAVALVRLSQPTVSEAAIQ